MVIRCNWMQGYEMLILRGLLGGLVQLMMLGAMLIVPAGLIAGAWSWPDGWRFLLIFGVMQFFAIIAMALIVPDSLERRLQPPVSDAQPKGDKLATVLVIAGFVVCFSAVPVSLFALDHPPIASTVRAVGGVVALIGYIFIFWTFFANSYASPVVEDLTDEGQSVIETGPYAVVRHPMYLGLLFLCGGVSLWLGSWSFLVTLPLLVLILANRIRIEEQELRVTLPGYEDFCAKRRFRLIPMIW